MSRIAYIFLLICFVLILAHVWGALEPSHWNWGVHMFAFYGLFFSLLASALSVSLFLPNARKKIRVRLERLVKKCSSLPLLLVLVILASALIALALTFRAKYHLLGDGALLLREVAGLSLLDETPPAFDHQPLVEIIFRQIKNFSQTGPLLNPETTFLVVDIGMGILFIIILVLFLRTFKISTTDKTLLGCFIFFCGGSQFFLGYVELYVFLYTMTLCFVITGWLALEKRLHTIIPILCFGILLGLHFASLVFVPSVIILLYGVWRERKLEATVIAVAGILAVLLIIIIRHVDLSAVMERISKERTANILPMFTTDRNFINPMISWKHFLDWVNANLLVAPTGIAVAVVLLVAVRKQFRWNDSLLLFLISAAFCGIFFTFVMSSGLGMARDWDFLASFFLPLVVLNVYLLKLYLQSEEGKSIIIALVGITLLHWMAWIGVNASEERHLQRAKLLDNPQLLGFVAQLNYYETLGSFFYTRTEYSRAREYFDHYVAIESSNTRILANVSELYKKLGDEQTEFRFLRRAATLHSRNPSVYLDLGVLYANRGDTVSAIALNMEALRVDSTLAKAQANLAILYFAMGNYRDAAERYTKAITLGLTTSFLYRDAATSLFFLGKYDEALKYEDAYLELEPGDANVKTARDQLRDWISQQQKK